MFLCTVRANLDGIIALLCEVCLYEDKRRYPTISRKEMSAVAIVYCPLNF